MATSITIVEPNDSPNSQIPPLEAGDRLTRAEFERRYEAMPHLKKAELIEGVVYMPSPVRLRRHGKPHAHLIGWLVAYETGTPGVETGDNSTARLDLDNEPQPDALLLIDPARGGQARVSDDDYVEEAPELVGEVASSSVSYDLHTKLNVYRRNGVREYLVWRVVDREIDWFVLRDGQYERQKPDAAGYLRSEVFPGLWLDPVALVRGDLPRLMAVLQQGLASPEHAAFVARLNPAGPSP
jgi:Uma2 family endonuclease